MSKKSKNREYYNIGELLTHVKKNSTESEPVDYNGEKMAIFGANINLKRHVCVLIW